MPAPLPVGKLVSFTLHIPALAGGGTQPLQGTAKVASARMQGGLHRVSFSFATMSQPNRELLDISLIDYVLRRFVAPA